MKNYREGHIRVIWKSASREKSGNGWDICYGSLRITSLVPSSSGTLRFRRSVCPRQSWRQIVLDKLAKKNIT